MNPPSTLNKKSGLIYSINFEFDYITNNNNMNPFSVTTQPDKLMERFGYRPFI